MHILSRCCHRFPCSAQRSEKPNLVKKKVDIISDVFKYPVRTPNDTPIRAARRPLAGLPIRQVEPSTLKLKKVGCKWFHSNKKVHHTAGSRVVRAVVKRWNSDRIVPVCIFLSKVPLPLSHLTIHREAMDTGQNEGKRQQQCLDSQLEVFSENWKRPFWPETYLLDITIILWSLATHGFGQITKRFLIREVKVTRFVIGKDPGKYRILCNVVVRTPG